MLKEKHFIVEGKLLYLEENKRMLSMQEKELWIFESVTTIIQLKQDLKPNVCGSTPVQPSNIFAKDFFLSCRNKRFLF